MLKPVPNRQVYVKGVERGLRTKADGEGRFEFKGLPAGRYTVRTFSFRKPGEKPLREAIQEVELRSGEKLELTLEVGGNR